MKNIAVACFLTIGVTVAHADPFITLTATKGSEWVDQCERPATKSDWIVRNAACTSYIVGAKNQAMTEETGPRCRENLAHVSPGALLDVSFSMGREFPDRSLQDITAFTIAIAKGLKCRD
ncbi:hypothetical protein QZM48_04215 [Burkholderia orbicola]|uniref:hypothetical protein n=1 Tax=Burkholderia orbicola TaxID=2978683 RepID=UPI00264E51B8|nr:hypothetical protein [Burkholderia orbicola]MDN7729211.1 hypothetical protein [Burkholderia orbicola]